MSATSTVSRAFSGRRIAYHAFTIALVFVVLAPVLYALLISFTSSNQVLQQPPNYIPSPPTTENYEMVNRYTTIGRYMLNSFVLAGGATAVRMFVAVLAAFAFAFLNFRGRNFIFMAFLATIMVPGEVTMLSNYGLVADLGLVDTYPGVMAVYLANALNIFMLRQAFLTFPNSLREAAELDGCNNLRFITKILLPSNVPVLVAVSMSSFIMIWNSYLWPLLVTNRNELRVVQVGITQLSFPEGSAYGAVMAGSIVVLIPCLIVFLIFRRNIVGGMMAGSLR